MEIIPILLILKIVEPKPIRSRPLVYQVGTNYFRAQLHSEQANEIY